MVLQGSVSMCVVDGVVQGGVSICGIPLCFAVFPCMCVVVQGSVSIHVAVGKGSVFIYVLLLCRAVFPYVLLLGRAVFP